MRAKTAKRTRFAPALLILVTTSLLSGHIAAETFCLVEGVPQIDNPWSSVIMLLDVDDSPTMLEGLGVRTASFHIHSGVGIDIAGDTVPITGDVVEGVDQAGTEAWIVSITGTLAQFSQPWLKGIPYYVTTQSLVIPKDRLDHYGTPGDLLSAIGTAYVGNILMNKSLFNGSSDDFTLAGEPLWRMHCSAPRPW